jgi:hypothetical protein
MAAQPLVAIVGGVRKETLQGFSETEIESILDRYRTACRDLGAALAKAGFRLLVWSSDTRFIESGVVDGYLSQDSAADSILCVWHKEHPVSFPRQNEPDGPISLQLSPHDDWEVGFYESMREEAHAIILLGGGSTTLVAGVVAASWGKAIFATPHFHGKAEMLYRWIYSGAPALAAAPVTDADIELMSKPWSSRACIQSLRSQLEAEETRSKQHADERERYAQLEESLSADRSLRLQSVAACAALLVFVGAMTGAMRPDSGVFGIPYFFLVLMSGGALGALLSVIGTRRVASPIVTTTVIGAGVGVITGVLQMAPNITKFFPADKPPQVDTGLAFSAALFASLAGLAFESTLENLINRGRRAAEQAGREQRNGPGQTAARPAHTAARGARGAGGVRK